ADRTTAWARYFATAAVTLLRLSPLAKAVTSASDGRPPMILQASRAPADPFISTDLGMLGGAGAVVVITRAFQLIKKCKTVIFRANPVISQFKSGLNDPRHPAQAYVLVRVESGGCRCVRRSTNGG